MNLPIVSMFGAYEALGIKQLVRFVGDKPVASDVAKILGYKIPKQAIQDIVSSENKEKAKMIIADGRLREVVVLREEGIYELVFRSRKGIAKEFKQWIFGEVLPSIRKKGYYSLNLVDTELYEYEGHALRFTGNKLVGVDLAPVFKIKNIEERLTSLPPQDKDKVLIKTEIGGRYVVTLVYPAIIKVLDGCNEERVEKFLAWLEEYPLKEMFSNVEDVPPSDALKNAIADIMSWGGNRENFVKKLRGMVE